jgi:mRNA interferase RelE/StbE
MLLKHLLKTLDHKVVKKLKGREGYRIRKGDYRTIYDIFDGRLVISIVAVGHRREIYD